MTAALAYTPESNDTLPILKAAHEIFTEKSARDVLDGAILDLSEQYPEACQKFGPQLLHRHFSMTNSEILVEIERTSTPWHVKNLGNNATVMQGRVFPRSWRLSADSESPKFKPYEFRYVLNGEKPLANPNDPENEAFVEKLTDILKKYSLENVLCITPLTPEVKPLRGFICVPKWLWEKTIELGKDSIEAIFVFTGANEGVSMATQRSSPYVCMGPGLDSATGDWDSE
ncbi:hypothetical protein N8I77_011900 [Diaporthe amygdali]|uniref:Uncharacterized protein n=1 Tax=Phomopsis amygdali TaxID=1214568 RepID=A0AAD9S6L0_PHOAM|nr:hypothetical protein N8I77_011900 [Diaporthe amygdali]